MKCSYPYEIARSLHAVAFLIQRYDHAQLIFLKNTDRSSNNMIAKVQRNIDIVQESCDEPLNRGYLKIGGEDLLESIRQLINVFF